MRSSRHIYGKMSGVAGALSRMSFIAPLKNSLILDRGTGDPTFTRADGADRRATVVDYEGRVIAVKAGEARFTGARRVENLVASDVSGWATTANNTVGGSVSDPDGGTTAYTITATNANAYRASGVVYGVGSAVHSAWVRRRTGTGTVLFYNGGDGSATTDITSIITGSWQRISAGVIATAGAGTGNCGFRINTSGDAIDVWHPQAENVTGQSNQNPSEYVSVGTLSAPYHGAGVDGVKYFSYENGNTVV